jgi:hypothetical protein
VCEFESRLGHHKDQRLLGADAIDSLAVGAVMEAMPPASVIGVPEAVSGGLAMVGRHPVTAELHSIEARAKRRLDYNDRLKPVVTETLVRSRCAR